MEEARAELIAAECLYVLMGARKEFPEAYEYFATQMDLSDERIEEAFKVLFPNQKV